MKALHSDVCSMIGLWTEHLLVNTNASGDIFSVIKQRTANHTCTCKQILFSLYMFFVTVIQMMVALS